MQLEEMYRYKNQLMEDLLTNRDIVRLINDKIDIECAPSLMYRNVFPYERVPETVEHAETFICCDVDIQKSLNSTYLLPTLYIWVFTHDSLIRLPNGGGVRTDAICSEIAREINGSRFYGLGELDLYSVKRFAPMTDYSGKVMTFYAKDWNRAYDPSKPTPKNRRSGI